MEPTLSVTEAARNFADVVNRAYYRHESTTLLKNGKPVARVVPAGPSMRTGKEIAAEMTATRPRLGVEEAEAFEADLLKARAELPLSVSPWD
ncbi:MAG: type II toxin-antitoxin system Phd/YefM family antitoxin [Chthoniobacteraceae bacterium]